MKKQELIHLHGLLAEVGNYLEAEDSNYSGEVKLDEYDSLGVRPTSIHKSKTDHKDATMALVNEISYALSEDESTEQLMDD